MMKTFDEFKREPFEKLLCENNKKICIADGDCKDGERYLLAELFGDNPLICFGVNPSTATAEDDPSIRECFPNKKNTDGNDPTIRKIKKIAENQSDGGWIMLNLYPQRATNPDNLDKVCNPDLVSKNNEVVKEVFRCFPQSKILAAWGDLVDKRKYLKDCRDQIIRLGAERKWRMLGSLTNSGNPRHPLSRRPFCVNADTPLEKFDVFFSGRRPPA